MKRIKLTKGQFAIVDDSDFERLNKHKWLALKNRNTWYAVRHTYRNGIRVTIGMHREIMGIEPGDPRLVDHKNHNGLNNWRENLRICTNSQNHQNENPRRNGSSVFRGVYWNKAAKKWRAQIRLDGHARYLGSFHSETEAARAYDQKAKELFGEFACVNAV